MKPPSFFKKKDLYALHYPEPSAAWLSPAIAQLGHLIGPLPCTQAEGELSQGWECVRLHHDRWGLGFLKLTSYVTDQMTEGEVGLLQTYSMASNDNTTASPC